ncbi:hypothetical protein TNCV_3971611 [Trichonephila clavipes]|nr:hypothetical protein TNCV_3971611 [Trichonephila clavipes]
MNEDVSSPVARVSDSSLESLGSMLDVTKYPSSPHGFHTYMVEIGGVAIYRPFGNFSQLIRTVTLMVAKANDRQTSSPLLR